jgi:hypothetical protein
MTGAEFRGDPPAEVASHLTAWEFVLILFS